MVIVDRIVWERRHGAGNYCARVYLHIEPMQAPEAMRAWFDVTRARTRGQGRQWRAVRTSMVYQRGTPELPVLDGYGAPARPRYVMPSRLRRKYNVQTPRHAC